MSDDTTTTLPAAPAPVSVPVDGGPRPAGRAAELLTLAEAARLVGISDRALRKRVYKGVLEARRDVRGGRAVMVVERGRLEALFPEAAREGREGGPDPSGPGGPTQGGPRERALRTRLDRARRTLLAERRVRARVQEGLAEEREELARERDERRRLAALADAARQRVEELEREVLELSVPRAAARLSTRGFVLAGIFCVLVAWGIGRGFVAVREARVKTAAAEQKWVEAEELYRRATELLEPR